jgi:hypothetical protein
VGAACVVVTGFLELLSSGVCTSLVLSEFKTIVSRIFDGRC